MRSWDSILEAFFLTNKYPIMATRPQMSFRYTLSVLLWPGSTIFAQEQSEEFEKNLLTVKFIM